MKIKNMFYLIVVCLIFQACGIKNNSSLEQQSDKPVSSEQNPENSQQNDNNEPNIQTEIPDTLTHDENQNKGKRVYLIRAKKMLPQDISFYTGLNTNAGHIEGDKWVVDIASGYGNFGNPIYMDKSDKNYSLIVEYEIAAIFDKKYRAPYSFIEIFNDGEVIYEYPINDNLGSINGDNIQYTKIRFKTENIPSAYNLQPRFRTFLQDNKKIYIKSIEYFLTKPIN